MRLISPFHDYYDTVLAQGADDRVRFVRRTQVNSRPVPGVPWACPVPPRGRVCGPRFAGIHPDPWPVTAPRLALGADLEAEEAFALVAGKAYPVWVSGGTLAHAWSPGGSTKDQAGHPALGAWLDVLQNRFEKKHGACKWWLDRAGTAALRSEAPDDRRLAPLPSRHGSWRGRLDRMEAQAYADARAAFLAQDHTALHLEEQTPVLLVAPARLAQNVPEGACIRENDDTIVVRNPNLRTLNLNKVLDPYTAFQDISQFIAGIMPGQQSPMVQLTDREQVVKKGFDLKYGFRKRPAA